MEDFGQLYPDDVLVDIFCRLTVKDLIRFKCVCKNWCRVISNTCVPIFSRKASVLGIHFRTVAMSHELIDEETSSLVHVWWRCKKNVRDRFYGELRHGFDKHFMGFALLASVEPELGAVDGNNIGYPYSNLSVDFVPPNHAEEFMDSCSGLLLLVKEYAKYFVCNPTTKQCVAIPKLRACCNCSCPPIRFHAALAFDPCVSSHYRIVHFSLLDPRLAEIGIFSSCSGVWVLHRVPLGTSIPEFSFLRSNVYFDGMLYMISRSWKILCFDVNKVSFHVIELPDGMEKRGHRGCIGLSLGHLCYVRGDYPYMSLWSLDSSGGSYDWVLKHSLNIALLDQRFVYRARKFEYHHTWTVPCGIDPNSEAVFIGTSRQIVRYYIKTDKIEVVYETRAGEVLSTWYHSVFTYTSCLVPLKRFSS